MPKPPDPNCTHMWSIASPGGPTSAGTCDRCGGERDFFNAAPDLTMRGWNEKEYRERVERLNGVATLPERPVNGTTTMQEQTSQAIERIAAFLEGRDRDGDAGPFRNDQVLDAARVDIGQLQRIRVRHAPALAEAGVTVTTNGTGKPALWHLTKNPPADDAPVKRAPRRDRGQPRTRRPEPPATMDSNSAPEAPDVDEPPFSAGETMDSNPPPALPTGPLHSAGFFVGVAGYGQVVIGELQEGPVAEIRWVGTASEAERLASWLTAVARSARASSG